MPQVFQVLRCYKCEAFQIHQMKKSIKWECKICGEKQSVKRHYGVGTGKDCRLHVQRLNSIRGNINQAMECNTSEDEENLEESGNIINICDKNMPKKKQNKWCDYVDEPDDSCDLQPDGNSMYLDAVKVVLEIPKKKSRKASNKSLKNINVCVESTNILSYKSNTQRRVTGKSRSSSQSIGGNEQYIKFNNSEDLSDVITEPVDKKIKLIGNNIAPSTLTMPILETNSKWAQYVEEEKLVEYQDGKIGRSDNDNNLGCTTSIFSLSEDGDIDDILNI